MSLELQHHRVAPGDDLAGSVMRFVRRASTEISTHDEDALPALARVLPQGMTLYVAHTPKAGLEDVVRVAVKAQALGFRASPHLVARRIVDERALRAGIGRLTDAGVEQALLIAGDLDKPAGPFAKTRDVLDSGVLDGSGVRRLGFAGHPEGHRSVAPAELREALLYKQAFAARAGLQAHIVTQFAFNAGAVLSWSRSLGAHGVQLPVHAGIAGPTPLTRLVKFAMQCGVGVSMGTMLKNAGDIVHLTRLAKTADELVPALIHGGVSQPDSGIAQPHFYALGGALATASWLRAITRGDFVIEAGGRRLAVDA
jgi:methylenetetrahydrofolate reductase (NADH)